MRRTKRYLRSDRVQHSSFETRAIRSIFYTLEILIIFNSHSVVCNVNCERSKVVRPVVEM